MHMLSYQLRYSPHSEQGECCGYSVDLLKANGKFDEKPLDANVEASIVAAKEGEEALLKDSRSDACKIFVCATKVFDNSPIVFRSYNNAKASGSVSGINIWLPIVSTPSLILRHS
ncbi:uncharacterized protein LY89DRAFT_338869 [Mollisia scopiformis]|uniref:Uncharacterized protein n=1 Tax=Mollisia scopiformis TaxID=149040 RepID=A0A132B761_MOLSC|nr:uncharacterized protein LY89DRAFT_338869 [Mollisia scopiformis]KUJ08246.1 hypothetical protein LY89DRAFT_338869 [Mollisia scopiformis]